MLEITFNYKWLIDTLNYEWLYIYENENSQKKLEELQEGLAQKIEQSIILKVELLNPLENE